MNYNFLAVGGRLVSESWGAVPEESSSKTPGKRENFPAPEP